MKFQELLKARIFKNFIFTKFLKILAFSHMKCFDITRIGAKSVAGALQVTSTLTHLNFKHTEIGSDVKNFITDEWIVRKNQSLYDLLIRMIFQ